MDSDNVSVIYRLALVLLGAGDEPGYRQACARVQQFCATVDDPAELPSVLKDALAAVHGGRSAVVAVHLPRAQGT